MTKAHHDDHETTYQYVNLKILNFQISRKTLTKMNITRLQFVNLSRPIDECLDFH